MENKENKTVQEVKSAKKSRENSVIIVLNSLAAVLLLVVFLFLCVGLSNMTQTAQAIADVKAACDGNTRLLSELQASLQSQMDADASARVDLVSSIKTMDTLTGEFSKMVQENLGKKAEGAKIYQKAQDASGTEDQRRFFYESAIIHDPSNAEYYEGYIGYLQSVGASFQDYMNVYSQLNDAIYNASEAELLDLNAIVPKITDIVGKLVEDDKKAAEEQQKQYAATWTETYALIRDETLQTKIDQDKIIAGATVLSDLYSLLTNPTDGTNDEYQFATNFLAFSELHKQAETAFSTMSGKNGDAFTSTYDLLGTTWSGYLTAFALRDRTDEGAFTSLIDIWQKAVEMEDGQLTDKYDSILLASVDQTVTAYRSRFNGKETMRDEDRLFLQDFSSLNAILSRVSDAAKTASIVTDITALVTDIQNRINSEYQVAMAKKLEEIEKKVDNCKQVSYKYKTLYEYGFFNIPREYLISQLQTFYDELNKKEYRGKSNWSESELLSNFPVTLITPNNF